MTMPLAQQLQPLGHDVLTASELLYKVSAASPGDEIVYYVGAVLSRSRSARMARELRDLGLVSLVQRRLERSTDSLIPGKLAYIAQRTCNPDMTLTQQVRLGNLKHMGAQHDVAGVQGVSGL